MKSKRYSIVSTVLAITVVNLSLLLVLSGPAAAHHRDAHSKGGDSTSTVTEDNDDDGVANSPDPEGDSDNKHPSGKDKHDEAGGSGNQGKAAADPDGDSNGGIDQPGGSGGDDELDQDGNNGCGNDDDFEDDNNGRCLGPQKKAGGESPDGSSVAVMTIAADCSSVTVSSSKDISHVEVTFADGTSVKFDGLQGYEFSESFAHQVASATAKSGTTTVSAIVEDDCSTGTIVEEDVLIEDIVLGDVITRQPSDGDAVLGTRIATDAPKVALRPATNASVLGARLPFTGAEIWSFLAVALGMIATGGLFLRARSQKA